MAKATNGRRPIIEFAQTVALGVATFMLVWVSLSEVRHAQRVVTIWPLNAVVLACLLRTAPRRWPALIIAMLIGDTAANLTVGDQPIVAVGMSLCNIVEILICAGGLRRFIGRRIDLSRLKSLLAFGGLALLTAPIVSGLMAAALLHWRTGAPIEQNLATWALTDALGLLIITPALLTLTPAALKRIATGPDSRKNMALLGGFTVVLMVMFGQSRFPIQALVMPMLMVLAFQMEVAGAALGALLVATVSIAFLLAGRGPEIRPGVDLANQTYMLQFNLAVTAATALAIGATLAERRRDKDRLRSSLSDAERARAAATEANRRARTAEAVAKIGYWRLELANNALTWSEGMYRLYGQTQSNPPSWETAMSVLDPEERGPAEARMKQAISTGRGFQTQARLRRADGSWLYSIHRVVCERGPDGKVAVVTGTIHDVTDLRLADRAVRESEGRYRLLADHSTDIILRHDQGNVIRYISPSCRRYGYEPTELIGRQGFDIVHPDDRAGLERALADTMSGGEPTRCEYRLLTKAGEWIWFEGNLSCVADAASGPEIISQLRDITQRKAMETDLRSARDAAEAAATAKSEFLANMSHEIRTPLTSIMGFSSLLREMNGLPENAHRYLDRVSTAGQSLLSVVNDILDFSKLEAGQIQLDPHPFDPVHFIEDTVELFSVKAAEKGLSLRTAVTIDLPRRIEADAGRVRQVMLNLLGNAVKFTAEGGVTVAAAYDTAEEKLRIAIRDTGQGVPAERRDRLFQRFSQVDGSISRVHGGTGLGLAISKNLVDLMGGEIGFDANVDEGSTFWFTVRAPLAESTPIPMTPVVDEPAYEGRACRILVVDDVSANRELIRAMLAPFGHTFEEADNGAAAVFAAIHTPFDLILMDLQMPGMDGYSAAEAIRATAEPNRRTPILAISANVLTEHLEACRKAGMNDHIAKPIQPVDLLLKVAQWTSEPVRRNIA